MILTGDYKSQVMNRELQGGTTGSGFESDFTADLPLASALPVPSSVSSVPPVPPVSQDRLDLASMKAETYWLFENKSQWLLIFNNKKQPTNLNSYK